MEKNILAQTTTSKSTEYAETEKINHRQQ